MNKQQFQERYPNATTLPELYNCFADKALKHSALQTRTEFLNRFFDPEAVAYVIGLPCNAKTAHMFDVFADEALAICYARLVERSRITLEEAAKHSDVSTERNERGGYKSAELADMWRAICEGLEVHFYGKA